MTLAEDREVPCQEYNWQTRELEDVEGETEIREVEAIRTTEQLLAEYHGIDLKKLSAEKDRMVDECRKIHP